MFRIHLIFLKNFFLIIFLVYRLKKVGKIRQVDKIKTTVLQALFNKIEIFF